METEGKPKGNALVVSSMSTAEMRVQVEMYCRSAFRPKHLKTMADALAAAMLGRELGVPPVESMRNIYAVDGRAFPSVKLTLAIIYRKIPTAEVDFLTPPEESRKVCRVRARRSKDRAWQTFEFTIDDAQGAGLLSKDVWRKYPADMLKARAVKRMAEWVFPDALVGFDFRSPNQSVAEEILEGEYVAESTEVPQADPPTPKVQLGPSDAQITRLYTIASKTHWSRERVHEFIGEKFSKESTRELTKTEYEETVRYMVESTGIDDKTEVMRHQGEE